MRSVPKPWASRRDLRRRAAPASSLRRRPQRAAADQPDDVPGRRGHYLVFASPRGGARLPATGAARLPLCGRCWDAHPAVEFVEDVLHNWAQLVSDLGLALAVAGAPAGIDDDDLEHRGERDPPEPGDLRRDGGGIADGGGQGHGLAVGQLQHQPVNRRADRRQVAELATPDLRWDAADSGDGFEDEAADRSGRGNAGRASTDQVAQPVLNLLLAISDQLLLGWEVVVDRLLGDLGLARHIADRDTFVAALGEQAGRGVGDEPARARLLKVAQSGGGHPRSLADLLQDLIQH